MPEVTNVTVVALHLIPLFMFLCRTCVLASYKDDYDELFRNILPNSEDQSGSLLQRLLFPPEIRMQRPLIMPEQNGGINPFLSSDYVEERYLLPVDYEHYSFETPSPNEPFLSQTEVKLDNVDAYANPSLTKVLEVIDQLKMPDYKPMSINEVKRNSMEDNTAFGTLVDAAYRLGRLDGSESKTESRRFHSWGG